MESSGILLALLCFNIVSVLCSAQTSREVSEWDSEKNYSPASKERVIVEAMEVLLGKFQDRLPSSEKRATIPLCSVRERCAMKLGPRIGQLCDCGRRSSCNSFLLKCI